MAVQKTAYIGGFYRQNRAYKGLLYDYTETASDFPGGGRVNHVSDTDLGYGIGDGIYDL